MSASTAVAVAENTGTGLALRAAPSGLMARLSEEQQVILRQQIAPNVSDGELEYFLTVSQHIGMDPFAVPREIYCIPRTAGGQKKATIQLAVDGYLKLAARTGEFEGLTPIEYQVVGKDKEPRWTDVWTPPEVILAARVGIWRKGFRAPLMVTCRMAAYRVANNPMWNTMPDVMLGNAAIRLACRRAFPAGIIGEAAKIANWDAEPPVDFETGEFLPPDRQPVSRSTRAALHNGHTHEEVHAAAVEVAAVESVRDLTEDQAQMVLEVLNNEENN